MIISYNAYKNHLLLSTIQEKYSLVVITMNDKQQCHKTVQKHFGHYNYDTKHNTGVPSSNIDRNCQCSNYFYFSIVVFASVCAFIIQLIKCLKCETCDFQSTAHRNGVHFFYWVSVIDIGGTGTTRLLLFNLLSSLLTPGVGEYECKVALKGRLIEQRT